MRRSAGVWLLLVLGLGVLAALQIRFPRQSPIDSIPVATAYPAEGETTAHFNALLAARNHPRGVTAKWVDASTLEVTTTARTANEMTLAQELCMAASAAAGRIEIGIRLLDHGTDRFVGSARCKA